MPLVPDPRSTTSGKRDNGVTVTNMIIILLGAPGAGKGTQSEILKDQLDMVHVSSGDLLRENIKNDTELGRVAKGYMTDGGFVPDDLIISMITDRLALPDAERGVLLDGFPRTGPQAQALDKALSIGGKQVNAALYIVVDDDVLLDRLSGRWICRNCGHIYHERNSPPKVEGVCDVCGGELYQRDDDTRETAIKRVAKFHNDTMPIIEYYRKQGKMQEVNGDQSVERV
ncbi:MAG: adenylate kinase, partial [Chloroflexia bacterium]